MNDDENQNAKSKFPWLSRFWSKPKEKRIDTLTSFVLDAEQEMLAILQSLQTQIDLLHAELEAHKMPRDRFSGLNRSIARLIADAGALSSIAKLAKAPLSRDNVSLDELIQEVIAETLAETCNSRVSITCTIVKGTMLRGSAISLKQICKQMLAVVVEKSQALDKINIDGITQNKFVRLAFETGLKPADNEFEPWQVGQLNSVPTNGDGIKLAAIDAMARMHLGYLEVCRLPDVRDRYRLILR